MYVKDLQKGISCKKLYRTKKQRFFVSPALVRANRQGNIEINVSKCMLLCDVTEPLTQFNNSIFYGLILFQVVVKYTYA